MDKMIITLKRKSDNGTSTLGDITINDLSFVTIEDTYNKEKVWGHTRIPSGVYEIKLKDFGQHHDRYKQKFEFHKGMLWLQDVPGFENILIHIGNTSKDTAGCILIGKRVINSDFIGNSKDAYIEFYLEALKYIEKEPIYIKIIDN